MKKLTILSRKNIRFFLPLFILMMLFMGFQSVSVSAEPEEGAVPVQIKKSGKYYWKDENGILIKKAGWLDIGKNTYFLSKTGACYTGFHKIKNKLYYFNAKGRLSKKTGWSKGTKYTYYYRVDHSLATGRVKIGAKYYIFDSKKGRLQKNKSSIKVGKYYYSTDKNGVAKKVSSLKAKCSAVARAFINKHSKASQSKASRFRSCFNYMVAYMRYTPGFFSMNADYAKMGKKDFQYSMALEMFNSSVLRGNCHRFACCVAAVAAELGYNPYVVVTTGDHSFVMIDGRYYDNMGPLFGASSHSPYSVYKKVKM